MSVIETVLISTGIDWKKIETVKNEPLILFVITIHMLQREGFLFTKIPQANSRTTEPNIGLFVLI